MKELLTGWLSPEGYFYPCPTYEHYYKAKEIIKNLSIKVSYDEEPDEKLIEMKYVQIGISSLGKKEWRIYWKKFLTDEQKNFLKKYFEDIDRDVDSLSLRRWELEI